MLTEQSKRRNAIKRQYAYVEKMKRKETEPGLPGVLYTVPTSSLKLPIIVPDRSKFREYKTYRAHHATMSNLHILHATRIHIQTDTHTHAHHLVASYVVRPS